MTRLWASFWNGSSSEFVCTIVEFTLAGEVLETLTISFGAEGIGQQACP